MMRGAGGKNHPRLMKTTVVSSCDSFNFSILYEVGHAIYTLHYILGMYFLLLGINQNDLFQGQFR